MPRLLAVLLLVISMVAPLQAQDAATAGSSPREATGGAQTLEDILARQQGLKVDDNFRRDAIGDPGAAAQITDQLGTLGGASDPELWRAIRYNSADISATNQGPAATVLVQDRGMWWLQARSGPLLTYGIYLLAATVLLLAAFYLIRGRIRIDGEKTGRRIVRFTDVERFGHWLLATSFLLLGVTGLLSLAGRKWLIPVLGKDAFSTIAIGTKWIHNNVSWAFMVALILIFIFWVVHNLPDRTDLNWLAKGGGLFAKGHPPAKKFNAGQKLIFWSVIVLGGSISLTGLALLFPFDINLFGPTFEKMNAIGLPGLLGMEPFPTSLTPQGEMQFAQLWHAIVSFVLLAIILAHIYIGSIGMEGAFDAMGKGEVEEQWAREHHSLWVDEIKGEKPVEAGKEA